jgi:uncharacterized protein (TIGR04255 family)
VVRVAVRYINRIDFPASDQDRLKDFLNVYAALPESVASPMSGFLIRLELHQPDLENGLLILNVGRTQPPRDGLVSILLDLDIFRQKLDESPVSSGLWDLIEDLHRRENVLFESFITDRTRGLFA